MSGFTLMEMLLVVTLVSLATMMTYPFYREFEQQASHRKVVVELQHAIAFARLSAVLRQREIVFCPAKHGRVCGKDWTQGFLIATIEKNAKIDQVLQRFPRMKYGRLSWQGFPKRQYLLFSPVLMTINQNGKFLYCPDKKLHQAAVVFYLNRLSRLRVEFLTTAKSALYCNNSK